MGVENLKYALAVVPKDKLSLGIPVYCYYWFAGMPVGGKNVPNNSTEYIGTPAAMQVQPYFAGEDPVEVTVIYWARILAA